MAFMSGVSLSCYGKIRRGRKWRHGNKGLL
jgi:hypothetical protein